jgi:hypothetical protein
MAETTTARPGSKPSSVAEAETQARGVPTTRLRETRSGVSPPERLAAVGGVQGLRSAAGRTPARQAEAVERMPRREEVGVKVGTAPRGAGEALGDLLPRLGPALGAHVVGHLQKL